jgi:circadian clock protein KaiC
MSERKKVTLKRLPIGVFGLDEVLGGGIPEYSFNLIAGPPGAGKTTLAHQIMFTNALPERPALYFTVLGESPLKMLRYQQQMQFFDPDKVGAAVRFVNLSQKLLENGLTAVLQAIQREVETTNPGLVIVDSFRTLRCNPRHPGRRKEGESTLYREDCLVFGELADDQFSGGRVLGSPITP